MLTKLKAAGSVCILMLTCLPLFAEVGYIGDASRSRELKLRRALERHSPAKKPRASQSCHVLKVFISSHGYQLGPETTPLLSVPFFPLCSLLPFQFLHKFQGVRFEIDTSVFIQEYALFP